MISTWSSKNFNSTSKLHLKCKQIWFKILEFSRNLKSHLTTSLKNAKEALLMNWLSACTAESIHQERLSSVIRVTLRKCTLSDKASLKCSTMRTTRSKRKSLFCTYQNILTSETIRSYTTWNQTWFSKLWPTLQIIKRQAHQNSFPTSFSCVSPRMSSVSFAIYSLRLLRTSSDGLLKEGTDLCCRRITILGSLNPRRRILKVNFKVQLPMTPSHTWRMKKVPRTKMLLKTFTRMRNQRISKVKKKTWRCILTN